MAKRVFNTGDIIRIELIAGRGGRAFEADFLAELEDRIVVTKTIDLQTEKVRKFHQNFFNSEVQSIQLIRAAPATINSNEETNNTDLQASTGVEEKKKFHQNEVERIQEIAKNIVHISQHDEKYHNAISDLKKQEIIFTTSENRFGRLEVKRPLLTMATPTTVYMFDLLRLGAIKKELKEIFSSDLPRKVIYGAAEFADYLSHKENCSLSGAFDVLVIK